MVYKFKANKYNGLIQKAIRHNRRRHFCQMLQRIRSKGSYRRGVLGMKWCTKSTCIIVGETEWLKFSNRSCAMSVNGFFSGDMQTKHGSVGVNSNCSLLSAHVFIDSMFMNLQRVRARKLRELDRPAPVYAI